MCMCNPNTTPKYCNNCRPIQRDEIISGLNIEGILKMYREMLNQYVNTIEQLESELSAAREEIERLRMAMNK